MGLWFIDWFFHIDKCVSDIWEALSDAFGKGTMTISKKGVAWCLALR